MAKEFFECEGEEFEERYGGEKNRFLTAKANFVKDRLNRMVREELVSVTKNSKNNVYILDNDKVVLKKMKFPDGKLKDCICIKDNSDKWMIRER